MQNADNEVLKLSKPLSVKTHDHCQAALQAGCCHISSSLQTGDPGFVQSLEEDFQICRVFKNKKVISALNKIDRWLLRNLKFLRRYARTIVVELYKQ